jgi:hypothetical protein
MADSTCESKKPQASRLRLFLCADPYLQGCGNVVETRYLADQGARRQGTGPRSAMRPGIRAAQTGVPVHGRFFRVAEGQGLKNPFADMTLR